MTTTTKFKDTINNEWDCKITFGIIDQIKELMDIDLSTLSDDPDLFLSIVREPRKFFDLLYAVLKKQADARNMTKDQFDDAISDGAVIEDALDCFVLGIANFSPRQKRDLLLKIWHKITETTSTAIANAEKEVDSIGEN